MHRLTLALAAAACLSALAASVAAGQKPERAPDPDEPPTAAELWERFPLGTAELVPATPASPAADAPPAPARRPELPRSTSDDSSLSSLLVAVTVGGALALLAAVFLTRRRAGDLPAGDRMLAALDEQDARLAALQAGLVERRGERARALASRPARCDMVTVQPPPDTGLASEPSEGHMGEVDHAANEAVGDAEGRNYGDIGNRVDKILAAAEQAAEQIRADAQEEAAAIRRRAEEASAARLQQLERETEQLRAEADSYARDTRQTGDSYASQQRRQAEEEVNRMLEEAETQARATREAAEVMAQRIEADARAGQVQLREHAKTVHARMQRAAAGLRDMAEQMEELLQAQLREAGDDSLVDALDPQGRRVPQS